MSSHHLLLPGPVESTAKGVSCFQIGMVFHGAPGMLSHVTGARTRAHTHTHLRFNIQEFAVECTIRKERKRGSPLPKAATTPTPLRLFTPISPIH